MFLLLLGIGLALLLVLAVFLGSRETQDPSQDPSQNPSQNPSQKLRLGLELRVRIVSNLSDPFGPVVVELVCKNVQEAESILVSPFPEWGFNPVFLLRNPKGQLFRSVNYRFGPPPTQSALLAPGQNISKVFNLSSPPYPGRWGGDKAISGFDLFSQAGEYQLTVVYQPFYHLRFTNRTRAEITMNSTLTFSRSRRLRILHLGTSNLSFLRRDLGSALLVEAGPGPYPAIDEAINVYDVLILDNVPPKWIGDCQAIRTAVMERGLDLVFFGGPLALGGNGSYSSWSDSPLGDLLPVECTSRYKEIPAGSRVRSVFTGPTEKLFEDLDTSDLDTVRHVNPCTPRPGAMVWFIIEKDPFLCCWQIGEGQVTVCAASLEEILNWGKGEELAAGIVGAAISD